MRNGGFGHADGEGKIANAKWSSGQRIQDLCPRRVAQGVESADDELEHFRLGQGGPSIGYGFRIKRIGHRDHVPIVSERPCRYAGTYLYWRHKWRSRPSPTPASISSPF